MNGKKSVQYTDEQLNLAIELATKGRTLKSIVEALITTEFHFYTYRQNNPDFSNRLNHARQEGIEYLADELLTLDETIIDTQRARLKSENYRWLISKRKPEVYGDKLDLNINQTIDISSALKDAKARTLKTVEPLMIDTDRDARLLELRDANEIEGLDQSIELSKVKK